MSEPQDLLIPASISSAPSVLIAKDFVASVATIETEAHAFVIQTADDAGMAAILLGAGTKLGTDLEKARNAMLAPYRDTQKQINAAAESVSARIDNAKAVIKGKINAYQDAQNALAAEQERKRKDAADEAERVRLAELKRLEDLAAAEKAEADRKAAELLKAQVAAPAPAAPAFESVDDEPVEEPPPAPVKSETELAIEKLKYAPLAVPAAPIVAPKIAGVSFRATLTYEVSDVNELPQMFFVRMLNTELIRRTFLSGWREGDKMPECPGLVFSVNRQPIAR